ncbi:hypothetical protein ABID95_005846 [Streptomyces atratus]|uniref:hypothetical protein n=1 Tax=Streptomyces atratus TaxID=1893 RepID=UPI00339B7753
MKGLVIVDPEAPEGFRRVSCGPVASDRPLRSPAMRKLVQRLVKHQMAFAEQERLDAEWVQAQIAKAPPLTAIQKQGLRRLKRDLTSAARGRMEEPVRKVA